MNINYIYKNIYFMNSFLDFDEEIISLYMSSRTITFKMFADYDKLIDESKFNISNDRSLLPLRITFEGSIIDDGYYLEIRKTGIDIKARNERGIRYAIRVLNDLVIQKQGRAKLPLIIIDDEPSFKYRGIIEGYYGEPWSYMNRLDLASFMDEYRLNTYMYAPKSDPFHRVKWNEPYPKEEFDNLIQFRDSLAQKDIDFYYCISPGYTGGDGEIFDYSNDDCFRILFRKINQVISQGMNKFGILLDDIDYKLSGDNLKRFKRPGIAHAYICNKVYSFLKDRVIDVELVMCPTEYHQIGDSVYREDLRLLLDKNIKVFWTGDNVCAEVITEDQAKLTKEAFDHELFIWDNFPVSDFTYGVRQYMAPLINRTVNLCKYASGYIINPMNLYEISKIAMITQSHYAWNSNKYDSEKSFTMAIKAIGEDFYEKGRDYIQYNLASVLSHGIKDYEMHLIDYDEEGLVKYISEVKKSAMQLLKLDLPIIDELKPWLERTVSEVPIIEKVLNRNLEKSELISFLENDKFSGSHILDILIKKHQLLTEDEENKFIKKRRGGQWYRIWEDKK